MREVLLTIQPMDESQTIEQPIKKKPKTQNPKQVSLLQM